MEPEPVGQEREVLDRFCAEYMIDGDYVAAAFRVGFQDGFAQQYGKQFLNRSYVQRRLRAMKDTKPVSAKDTDEYMKQAVARRMYEIAMDPLSKRSDAVRAAQRLATLHAWDQPAQRATVGAGHASGVIVVPVGSLDEWEAAATASQNKLIEDSRVD